MPGGCVCLSSGLSIEGLAEKFIFEQSSQDVKVPCGCLGRGFQAVAKAWLAVNLGDFGLQETFAVSREVFGVNFGGGVLLSTRGWRPEMLLTCYSAENSPHDKELSKSKTSVVLRWRNPGLLKEAAVQWMWLAPRRIRILGALVTSQQGLQLFPGREWEPGASSEHWWSDSVTGSPEL